MSLRTPFTFINAADQTACDWVFQEIARQGGHGEAVYAYDQRDGRRIAAWHERNLGANLDAQLEAALRNGTPVVLHHNHPSNRSFIPFDLQSLVGQNPTHDGLRPLAEMWAHGNRGTRYRIALICPGHAAAVVNAGKFMSRMKSQWELSCAGHEVFNSGWRHLVCLCLEAKGYVSYDYDVVSLPNYRGRDYMYGWTGQRLTQEQAFPLACTHIVNAWGVQF